MAHNCFVYEYSRALYVSHHSLNIFMMILSVLKVVSKSSMSVVSRQLNLLVRVSSERQSGQCDPKTRNGIKLGYADIFSLKFFLQNDICSFPQYSYSKCRVTKALSISAFINALAQYYSFICSLTNRYGLRYNVRGSA